MSGLRVITPPTGEQITLAEARLHLRLDDDGDSPAAHPDDAWLSGVGIPAARQYCEGWLGRALAPQTVEYALDAFPVGDIILPMAPVSAVTYLRYTDAASVVQTVPTTDYYFDNFSEPQLLRRVTTAMWPVTLVAPNAVVVRYQAGYSLPGDSPDTDPLPAAIKAAMLLVLGHLYEHREQVSSGSGGVLLHEIPLGVAELLRPYQIRMSMA